MELLEHKTAKTHGKVLVAAGTLLGVLLFADKSTNYNIFGLSFAPSDALMMISFVVVFLSGLWLHSYMLDDKNITASDQISELEFYFAFGSEEQLRQLVDENKSLLTSQLTKQQLPDHFADKIKDLFVSLNAPFMELAILERIEDKQSQGYNQGHYRGGEVTNSSDAANFKTELNKLRDKIQTDVSTSELFDAREQLLKNKISDLISNFKLTSKIRSNGQRRIRVFKIGRFFHLTSVGVSALFGLGYFFYNLSSYFLSTAAIYVCAPA
ncbi:MAG: hypothetical protein COC24_005205 [Alphaproteobacteria bacterium]|nr:hypothetical protein [Alphaproteobacteria bacterium]